ncbi:MAG: ribbon-helix-helix protein, CopG family [Bryobacteraceae bacterium]|nr:ribbon-helix-helix protein, CopG family [Bryobacteraceae bacterium]
MKATGKKAKTTEGSAANPPVRSGTFPRFFRKTNPEQVRRVELSLTESLLEEVDAVADELGMPREALIKALLRQALDQHYLAVRARLAAKRR